MTRNIAFLHENFPLGGAERITIDTATYLSGKGYRIYVFTKELNSDKKSVDFSHCYSEVPLPDNTKIQSETNASFMFQFMQEHDITILITKELVFSLLSYLKENMPELHLIYTNHGAPFWEILQKEALKSLKRKHGNWVLESLKWFLFDYFKYSVLRHHHKKVINIYRQLYDLSDKYVVLCKDYATQIEEILRIDPKTSKLCVIPNSEREVKDLNLKKKKQLLFVGRLSYADKRVDRLLDIWSMIYKNAPDWELLIVGDGPERRNLEERAQQLKLQRICFVGHSNEVSSYYRNASILCLTSTFEGWGLCLTEAQANGVIPIAFGCTAGVKEILSPNGKSGFIIPPFNLEKYASVLSKLMNDASLSEQIRPLLINRVKEFSIDKIGPMWVQLLEKLESH